MASIDCLNTEQQFVFDKVVLQLDSRGHGVFFVDGPGGTGKTFLYRALLAYVRRKGEIALAVASSGVAASLQPGGRTAHSRFKLPLDVDDVGIGKVSKQSSLARMISEASLIIWDEASMANRHSIEAFEALLADICDSPLPFGGNIVLFGGDFRQTLPIVVNGSRGSMITACLVSSALWGGIHRMQLCQNMRAKEDPNFIDLLLRIGNGVETFIFDDNIKIPSHMLVPFDDAATSLDRLIRDVYPNLDTFMQNPDAFVGRAILTPKNDCVDELNDLLMERFAGKMKEYISFNATTDPLQ
ncbi:PREDICTED: ATP-dependent DNA helicase PIF1-like [Erythranthe guttata]|uniref:ATP-dependent DNA helicase PIF1-like n=1 Tax=Erythranthe guttata TaxID=4155 RepID=UPI00064DBEF9|nr:PREDICTED: ATP-dependent DNA helicase PIF1-like [Erythranthe guttata]|eukprot:XP_012849576.1 PREDICTED: ATP-dependent DNA helicase PIF1-like [Erythranthe guttata]